MSSNFYNEQSDITAAKIKIYEEYITGYLPKIPMLFVKKLVKTGVLTSFFVSSSDILYSI